MTIPTETASIDDGVEPFHAPREDQRSEPFETPTQEEIVAFTGPHVEAMENSTAEHTWTLAGMKYVLITAKGRTSGQLRKTPLPYWRDEHGDRIVVASFAGSEHHPAWYHNIADRAANPTIRVQERDHVGACEVEVLDGDEYARVWAAVTTDRPFYLAYQAKVTRRIPLLRLRETTAG
ncbi:MAG: nitroreductase/quinone reductase family protein [Acidimicrobiia bacterium]|nr:nitroreductase/quinone reductase family protein [Acidimicrobiia bacterium]